jgi:bifunctional non-homologous end joining protein LigD
MAEVSAAFPEWVEPMAATLTQERFTGAGWTFERKLDGIRLLAYKRGENVRLLSRNGCCRTPPIPQSLKRLPACPSMT